MSTKVSEADRTITDLLDTLDGCISKIGPHTSGIDRTMTDVLDVLERQVAELRASNQEAGWEGPMAQHLCDVLRAAVELVRVLESVSQIAEVQTSRGSL